MPEHAESPTVSLDGLKRLDGVVGAEILVVHCEDANQWPPDIREQGEVFHQVQQPTLLAGAANHGFKGNHSRLRLVADLLPLIEVLPFSTHAADLAVASVRHDDKGVIPE